MPTVLIHFEFSTLIPFYSFTHAEVREKPITFNGPTGPIAIPNIPDFQQMVTLLHYGCSNSSDAAGLKPDLGKLAKTNCKIRFFLSFFSRFQTFAQTIQIREQCVVQSWAMSIYEQLSLIVCPERPPCVRRRLLQSWLPVGTNFTYTIYNTWQFRTNAKIWCVN